MLQGGDERQTNRLSLGDQLGRVAVDLENPVVGHGQDPGGLGRGAPSWVSAVEDGPSSMGRTRRCFPPIVSKHVGGDAEEPRGPRASLEAVGVAPRPEEGFLGRVFASNADPSIR